MELLSFIVVGVWAVIGIMFGAFCLLMATRILEPIEGRKVFIYFSASCIFIAALVSVFYALGRETIC